MSADCGGSAMSDRPGQYVRDHYGVPAFIGRRVRYTWPERHTPERETWAGKITGFDGAHLIVKFDDPSKPRGGRFHPTWEITYESAPNE